MKQKPKFSSDFDMPRVHENVVKKLQCTTCCLSLVDVLATCPFALSKGTQSASVIILQSQLGEQSAQIPPRWQIHCFIMMHYEEKHVWSSINPLRVFASFWITPSRNVFHFQYSSQWSIFMVLVTYFPFYMSRALFKLHYKLHRRFCARAENKTAGAESNDLWNEIWLGISLL